MAALSHAKSVTVGDATGTVTFWNGATTSSIAATDLGRPSDWNSAHNFYQSITGNTAGQSTASGTNLVIGGTNGVTVSMSTAAGAATLYVDAPRNATVSTYYPWKHVVGGAITGVTSVQSAGAGTSGIVYFYPIPVDEDVAAGWIALVLSESFSTVGTSSGRQTGGLAYGVYSKGTGASTSRLDTFTSGTFGWSVTGNNSSYTINYPTTTSTGQFSTGATNSGGVNVTSKFTGGKVINLPINSILTPSDYWIAIAHTLSTSSVNVGLLHSLIGNNVGSTVMNLAPIGDLSSARTTATNLMVDGHFFYGMGSWTTAGNTGVPASVGLNSITQGGVQVLPYMKIWST